MNISYSPSVLPVKSASISRKHLAFYALVVKLSRQEGYCWAFNAWLQRKCKVDRATVQRWIARLVEAGYLRREDDAGRGRRLYPLVDLAGLRGVGRRAVRKCGPSAAGLPTRYLSEKSNTQRAKPSPTPAPRPGVAAPQEKAPGPALDGEGAALAAALVEKGVRKPVALRLVREHGGEEIKDQIDALPYRKGRYLPGLLVAAILAAYELPRALLAAREQARLEAVRRDQEAGRRVLDRQREEEKEALARRWAALPVSERERREEEARREIAREVSLAWAWGRASEATRAKQARSRALQRFGMEGGT